MPILGQFLAAIAGAFATFFGATLAARVAVRLTAILAISGFAGVLLLGFNTVVAPLAAQMFSTPYGQLLGLVFPPVAGNCIAAIITTWASCTLYALKVKATRVAAYI